MAKKGELTTKQKAFADYYIQTGNATESAKRAGYSQKTSYSIGNENLSKPEIRQYIDIQLKKLEDERIADSKEVMQFLTAVMRGQVKDQFDLDASLQDRTKAAELVGKRYGLNKTQTDIEEQKLRIEKLRVETAKLSGSDNNEALAKLDSVLKDIKGVI